MRRIRGFGREGVFDQFLNRLEGLAGVVLKGLHFLREGIGQREQVADAAIDERKLLAEEAQALDAPEIADDVLQRADEVPEAEMLEVEQHVQVLELDVERGGRGDVGPGNQDARLRIEADAADRHRHANGKSEVRKARENRAVDQTGEAAQASQQFGKRDATGGASLRVWIDQCDRECALNGAGAVVHADLHEVEQPRQRIDVRRVEIHGRAHRRIHDEEMAREGVVVARVARSCVGRKRREIDAEGQRDVDRSVEAQLAVALNAGKLSKINTERDRRLLRGEVVGELDGVGEKVRRRVVADSGGTSAQQAREALCEFLRVVEGGFAGRSFEKRSDAGEERILEINEVAEGATGEGNTRLEDGRAAEEIEPRTELVQETDDALRRERIEVQ